MKVSIIGVAHKNSSTLLGSPYMQKEIDLLGIPITQTYADDIQSLQKAFQNVAKLATTNDDLLVLCPLSGNNHVDSLCIANVAKLCGQPLIVDEPTLSFLKRAGLSQTEAAALSTIPQGANLFPVKIPCIPGFGLSGNGVRVIVMPADLMEQIAVFFGYVFPVLVKASGVQCSCRIVRTMELDITKIEGAVRDLLAKENPCIAIYPKNNEIILRVSATANDKQEANNICISAMREVIRRLGSYVYGIDVSSIEQALALKCAKKGLKLYLAESGTGGGAAKKLNLIPGGQERIMESRIFQPDKMDLNSIGINDKIVKKFGAVSPNVAAAMALGASKQGGDNLIGIGISLPTASVQGQKAYAAACIAEKCLMQELSVTDYESASKMAEDAAAVAMNLARKFADTYPTLPKGAVSAQDAVLQGMAIIQNTAGIAFMSSQDTSQNENISAENFANKPKGFKKFLSFIFPNRDDSTFDKFRKIALIACVCVFCGSIFYLVDFGAQNKKSQDNISVLQDEMQQAEKAAEEGTVNIDGYPADYLPKFAPFYKRNEDIKGWLKIPNTNINFPVVQTSDNDYYHRLGFDKTYDYYGTPYLDYECDVKTPSTNLIIYGHNIKSDGQMFNDLTKYKQLSFYKENPVINFDSVYKMGSYKIIGAFLTNNEPSHDNGKVFEYTHFVNTKDEKEFTAFVDEVKKRSMFDTTVDTKTGDQLLTLSTCSYEFTEARFVVVARRVREGEDEKVDTTGAVKNEDAYYPAVYADRAEYAKKLGKVKGIAIEGNKVLALQVGDTGSLKAKVTPSNAPIQTCTWDSSNKAVATVDKKTGVVTAIGPGEAVITAVSDDGGYVDSAKVTVTGTGKEEAKLEKLELNASSLNIKPGATKSLKVKLTPAESSASLTWRSSDETIVKVTGDNKEAVLTAVNKGEAKITVSSSDDKFIAICTVKVSEEEEKGPASIAFDKGSLNMTIGKAQSLSVISEPVGTKPGQITYSWDGGDILKYSGEGTKVTLTPTAAGKGKLTATSDTGLTTSCAILITAEAPPDKPDNNNTTNNNTNNNLASELILTDLTFTPGQEGQMQYTVTPAKTKLVWTSSNPRIADVDENGYITTIVTLDKTATATITATTLDGKISKSAVVTVLVEGTEAPPPDKNQDTSEKDDLKLKVEDTMVDVPLEKEIPIHITTKDSSNITVECYSSDSNIATVTNDGFVTGVNPGSVIVTVTATNNKTGATKTAKLTVTVIGGPGPMPDGSTNIPSYGTSEDQRN